MVVDLRVWGCSNAFSAVRWWELEVDEREPKLGRIASTAGNLRGLRHDDATLARQGRGRVRQSGSGWV